MAEDKILINGQIHDWTDVRIFLGGEEYTGITSINWSSRKDKALQYAVGSAPHGIGYGHRSYSVDFTMTLENAMKFEKAANEAGKDALDYAPFSITIDYADKTTNGDGLIGQDWELMKDIRLIDVDVTDISESLDEGTQKVVRRYTAVAGKIVVK
ncbi:hypothetical protein GF359_05025 [candidate division WOR-3 bacterium]|uniref:Uncharacterized protein n=1 Tax=candidate division WOR-3 bacterium TaxID=2052148 RepID=A0A9D5QCD3_UNCW3|nr:hypothetical protein [candidate division WOR-3 bacterium]MBD3364558.1 hypothetical protein [candidate division WOR-3 bacterium]